MSWYSEDDEFTQYLSARKAGKPLGPDAPHYPNKAERVLLTQMMQKSGKTEAEIRENKANRIKLAEARKSMSRGKGGGHRLEVLVKRAKRNAAIALGVPVWDPKVIAYLNNSDHSYRGSIIQQIRRKAFGYHV